MCGIVGVYYFDREHPVDQSLLVAQADTLIHRGPDDGGVWSDSGIGLGHRRLSIIDLEGGAQPMADLSGRYVTVFNGEIYNYRELQQELSAEGHRFRTDSDTETLLAAYAQWGENCVDRFNGMFAFAVYDRENHELFLGRDRLGKKPLYYYSDKDRIVFGSELKAIVKDRSVPRELDYTSIADFFALAYIPAPKTIYRDVRKLPAGHVAKCDRSMPVPKKYWDITFSQLDFDSSAQDHANRLRELLADAVQLRLRADVPLGAFLSGGVDSSAVVGLMSQASNRPVVTQSVGFDVEQFDERQYAREIAQKFDTDHHEQLLTPDASRVAHQLSYFFDEPFGDSSAAPTFYLCEETRKHVKVALSGDGGDEQFSGYSHYWAAQWTQNIHSRLPSLLWRAAQLPLRHLFQVSRYNKKLHYWNWLAMLSSSQNPDRNAFNHLLPQPFKYRTLLGRGFLAELGGYDPFDSISYLYDQSGSDDPMSRMQYVDIKTYLCDDILVKVDRASMANSLEVRCPLLDHRVVEYASRIPPIHKWKDKRSKIVLKNAVADLIPPSFFERPKQGFAIPLDHWFRTSLAGTMASLEFSNGGKSGFLGRFKSRRTWIEHQKGFADHGSQLWNGMMFELWYRQAMNGTVESVEPTDLMASANQTRIASLDAVY